MIPQVQKKTRRDPVCRVRWGFEFTDGRKVTGLWNSPGEHKGNKAWAVDKRGLRYAYIEIEDLKTRKESRVCEIPGADYVNFQWDALAKIPLAFKGNAVKIRAGVTKLRLVGRYKEYAVDVCGYCDVKDTDPTKMEIDFRGHTT